MIKQFAGNHVLRGVSLTLHKGEIHAIVGGNGAGKSTLMKIITGLYKYDSGDMKIKNEKVTLTNTHEAHLKGVYLVPQEPLIFPNMSVEENILIGLPGRKADLVERIKAILKRLGWNLDLQRSALSLAIAEQQLVEIVRGLVREAEILILDEPTSTLTFGEIDSLFKTIKQLTEDGLGVLYITHRFSEIFQLAHSVSVLRDGVISAQGPISSFTYERLIEGLLPENAKKKTSLNSNEGLKDHQPSLNENEQSLTPILVVDRLTGDRFQEVSFQIHPGEILGIAGVIGAGRTELAETIFGLHQSHSGSVFLQDKEIKNLSIRERINQGLVYVPEDRHSHGIFSIATIQKNISSAILYRLKGWLLPFKEEKKLARKYVEALNIKATSTLQELKDLSGGNQQKVVLSKYLSALPKVIMLDEPTRGIDVHAREDIYQMIGELKTSGLSVLLISSDIEEIVRLSDTVLVMHEGKMVKNLSKQEIHADTITTWAFGIKSEVHP